MEHRDTEITDPTERMRIEFRYDFMGRRIEKTVYPGASGGGYSSTADSITRFIYDGWLLMAELDGKSGNALIRSYTWSRDISGTRSGAAGIGGLVLIYDAASRESCYPIYDPQHNIIGLVEADSGRVAARYEYGPFGEIIRVSGDAIAKEQPFGFSTKYTDRESSLVYYGYRYYQPNFARWLSRDPLGVSGGMNVYGFVGNNPLMFVDPLGLESGSGSWDPVGVALEFYGSKINCLKEEAFSSTRDNWIDLAAVTVYTTGIDLAQGGSGYDSIYSIYHFGGGSGKAAGTGNYWHVLEDVAAPLEVLGTTGAIMANGGKKVVETLVDSVEEVADVVSSPTMLQLQRELTDQADIIRNRLLKDPEEMLQGARMKRGQSTQIHKTA